ncbi:MAG: peptidoglycan DD-metalloendopeptidase family protein [Clostridia bacterium]|nr:peptidoglycan DD-metalloendopeptidase family protein [Clostridia bacterium]
MRRKIVAIIVSIIMIFSINFYTYAASVTDLQNQKKEIENNIKDTKKELEGVKNQKSQTLTQIEELEIQIEDSQDELDKLNAQVKELERSIAQTQKELEEAQQRQENQQRALEERMVAQYKSGTISYWDILLKPESPLQFISNLFMFEKIAKYDNELLESIEQEKQTIQTKKESLDSQKAQVKTAKANAEKENVKLKNAKMQKNNKMAQLSEEEKQLQQKLEQFNQEARKAEEEISKALASAKDYVGSFSGTLSWPISSTSYGYNIITSGYGKRDQPTAGASTNHKALDIGVRYQPIYAPADGYIVTAKEVSGYGNFIMIKHSNNLYTCYGHLSSYNVSAGQTVSRGQQIAISGNTGVTTGPHLHFEVRLNGTSSSKVNPLNYISDEVYSKLIFR